MKTITNLITLLLLAILIVQCDTKKAPIETFEDLYDFYDPAPIELPEQNVTPLQIGAKAPDFKLPGVDKRYYTLQDFSDSKLLVVIFTCNHCPTAQAYEQRLIDISTAYKSKSVAFVAISPTSPLGLLYEELGYSDLNDDYDAMEVRAKDMKYPFPYLYDGDLQKASLAYGPSATPQVFVFDDNRELTYHGRIDNQEKPGTGKGEDLISAIESTLNDMPVAVSSTKAFGCSTKWAWKTAYKKKADKDWESTPVSLMDIDDQGIKDLLKNDSENLRLINVWATWCGPCIIEYPDFIVLQRMYGGRNFEFVSLSADNPDQKDKALKFLEKKSSAVENRIYYKDDKYALIEAVDPEWNGALPYTLLIEPGGKIVWKHQGSIDMTELKKRIVDHPLIGRYY